MILKSTEYIVLHLQHILRLVTLVNIFCICFSRQGDLNDGKPSIRLLKRLEKWLPLSSFRYQTMDADYNFKLIYKQLKGEAAILLLSIINVIDQKQLGLMHFAPICLWEHSNRIVMISNLKPLKYTRPIECENYILANEVYVKRFIRWKSSKATYDTQTPLGF